MDPANIGSLVVRALAAMLWTVWLLRVARTKTPITLLARRAIALVIFAGMWLFVLGSLGTLGLLPFDLVRLLSTAFAALAGMVATALLSAGEPA